MTDLTTEQIEEIYRSITFTIGGKDTSELVPMHIRITHFLHRYSRTPSLSESLDEALTPRDRQLLLEFAQRGRLQFEEQYERETRKKRLSLICTHAQSMPVMELAAALDRFTQEHEEGYIRRYEALLESLSQNGQKAVADYISTNIRPTLSRSSWTALATKAPDYFRELVLADCEEARSGAQPRSIDGEEIDARTESESNGLFRSGEGQ